MDSVLQESDEAKKANNYFDVSNDEEFHKHLIREVARMMMEKKSLSLLWPKLQAKTGHDCKQLWAQMVQSATNKVMCLLRTNDLLAKSKPAKRLTSIDWFLFDIVLVHEKINVTKCFALPQCIKELYSLVRKYQVENLYGDKLAESWMQLTLEYNNGGCQCSPMLLQLRWYQLKEMSRHQVFTREGNLDYSLIKLLHDIAIKHQKIVTQPFPTWNRLVKEKRVILSEQFVRFLNRNDKWTGGKADEGWYLQVNTEAYDNLLKSYNIIRKYHEIKFIADNKPDTCTDAMELADDELDVILCEKPKIITNSNIPKAFHKVTIKDRAKVHVDVAEHNNKVKPNGRNETIDIEINKILRDKVKIISETSKVDLENIYSNEETFKEGNSVKRKKRQKDKSQEACLTSFNANTEQNHNEIDPKLLLDAIVSTRKLDSMTIFKYIEYDSVKDKKVIECAALESMAMFKRVTKNNQVRRNKHRHKTFSDQKITNNEADIDAGQNPHERACQTIKSTSWLFQKPKRRKYNPMELCRNPDFNNKLKIVTPEFFDSTRNRILLSECKPLTIDLHKQFEKKLVDGKCIILEVPYKKSVCNVNTVAAIETGRIEKIKTSKVIEHNNDMGYNKFSESSTESRTSRQIGSERRKIINLPSIDQVREINQSLLTAEVNPVQNLSKQSETTIPYVEPTVQSLEEGATLEIEKAMLDDANTRRDTKIFPEEVV